MKEPLLDISTLIERPTVDIDGVRYELLHPHELSIVESQRFARWADEATALQKAGTDPDILEAVVDQIAGAAMVGVPEEVFDRLKGGQKLAIAEVFTGLLLRMRFRAAGAIEKATQTRTERAARAAGADRSTGARTSPGSSGSTAVARASGWPRRLWRWFGLT